MRQIAASVLLKIFINGNKRCHTSDARPPPAHGRIVECKEIQPMIPEDEKYNFT